MNLGDMYAAAKNAPEAEFERAPRLTHEELPTGTEVTTEIRLAMPAKNDANGISVVHRVVDGEHAGGEFWESVYISKKTGAGPAGYNKRMFAKLEAAGLDEAFFSSGPSLQAVAKAVVGKKLKVKLVWDPPKDDRVYLSNNTTWKSVSEGGYVPGAPKGF